MYDAFAKIDGGGSGRDANDDLRIDFGEFLKGHKGVTNYGVVALQNLQDLTKKELKVLFVEKIDDNSGGIVLLDEWCKYIKNAEVEAGTAVGLLLNADETSSLDEQDKLTIGSPKKSKMKLKSQSYAYKVDAKPNSFGLAVARGKMGGSKDFFMFQDAFEPMCAETPEGEALRKEGFISADPNGNGLCSLAELETFVLKHLVAKYPRFGKGVDIFEPGKDLFDAFRPCYMRAFVDAKDYKANTGEVIEGTEFADDDDFVRTSARGISYNVNYLKGTHLTFISMYPL
jgi:hypothetical protein